FFSSRRRHTRFSRDWSSDVCSSDLDSEMNTRIVPGGSSVRSGAYIGRNVTMMPPMYVNTGAYVDDGTMIDSHALVGSCAQVGKQIGRASCRERVEMSVGAGSRNIGG